MSIVPSILNELSVMYDELLLEFQIALADGSDPDLIESLNDEIKATAQYYNEIAEEIS